MTEEQKAELARAVEIVLRKCGIATLERLKGYDIEVEDDERSQN